MFNDALRSEINSLKFKIRYDMVKSEAYNRLDKRCDLAKARLNALLGMILIEYKCPCCGADETDGDQVLFDNDKAATFATKTKIVYPPRFQSFACEGCGAETRAEYKDGKIKWKILHNGEKKKEETDGPQERL